MSNRTSTFETVARFSGDNAMEPTEVELHPVIDTFASLRVQRSLRYLRFPPRARSANGFIPNDQLTALTAINRGCVYFPAPRTVLLQSNSKPSFIAVIRASPTPLVWTQEKKRSKDYRSRCYDSPYFPIQFIFFVLSCHPCGLSHKLVLVVARP